MAKNIKIGIITSRGGHLYQIYRLKKFWVRYNRFWVTFKGKDTESLLPNETIYYAFYPESRNILNAIKNAILALQILYQERPEYLLSCGAGIAPPFFLAAKLMGIKTIFIEPYDFIKYQSLSGKMVAPFTDKYLVQHKEQLKFHKNAEFWGSTI